MYAMSRNLGWIFLVESEENPVSKFFHFGEDCEERKERRNMCFL